MFTLNRIPNWTHLTPIVFCVVLLAWFCWKILSGFWVAGFRDSSYFYYPLFDWLHQPGGDWLPLWNMYCNFGLPVVGDGTSGLLYPARIVFFFDWLSMPARYGIYLTIHLAIAFWGTYWLARRLDTNPTGATLAAITYAFGGTLLSLLSNVVFLVSAAWLPWALGSLFMVSLGHRGYLLGGSACCALMILGGDPQQVLHVGLIAVFTSFWKFVPRTMEVEFSGSKNLSSGVACDREEDRTSTHQSNLKRDDKTWPVNRNRCWTWKLTNLAILFCLTAILAAAQLLPTLDWAARSERIGAATFPRVLLDWWLPASVCQTAYQQAAYQQTDHQTQSENHKTSNRQRCNNDQSQWKKIFSPPGIGSVDDHIYQFSLTPWSIAEILWPNASGKMYPIHRRWSVGLPGADRVWYPSIYFGVITFWMAIGAMQFRKRNAASWLTFIGLFFGVAAFGWYGPVWMINELLPKNWRMEVIGPQVGGAYWLMMNLIPGYDVFRYPAKLFIIANLCFSLLAGIHSGKLGDFNRIGFFPILYIIATGLAAAGLTFGWLVRFWENIPADRYWGPFDVEGARLDLMLALFQGFIGVWGVWMMIKLKTKWMIQAILVLVAIDVAVANRWIVAEVPAILFSKTINANEGIDLQTKLSKSDRNSKNPLTIFRSRDRIEEPIDWLISSSPDRITEVIAWQRQTLYPKHHLGQTIDDRSIRLIGSFSSIWPETYERILTEWELESERLNQGDHLLVLDWPLVEFLPDHAGQTVADRTLGESVCHVQRLTNADVDLILATEQSGRLIFNTIFEGNWWAEVQTEPKDGWSSLSEVVFDRQIIPMQQGEQGLQELTLPAGNYRIRLSYWPRLFWLGMGISGTGWSLLIVFGTIGLFWPWAKQKFVCFQYLHGQGNSQRHPC